MDNIGKVYVASTLSNHARVTRLISALVSSAPQHNLLINITYDWTTHNNGELFVPDHEEVKKRRVALRELSGVIAADVIFAVMPGERGTHFEMGIAYALHTPIVLLLDEHDGKSPSFHFLDNVERCFAEDVAIATVIRHLKYQVQYGNTYRKLLMKMLEDNARSVEHGHLMGRLINAVKIIGPEAGELLE